MRLTTRREFVELMPVVAASMGERNVSMLETPCIELVALPTNRWMKLTAKSDTPFGKDEEQRERYFCPQLIQVVRRR